MSKPRTAATAIETPSPSPWWDLELPITETTQFISLAQYLADVMLKPAREGEFVTTTDWERELLMFALDQAKNRATSAERDFYDRFNEGPGMLADPEARYQK